MKKSVFSAASILVGTVIGAGIFGVPYAISQVGFIPGIVYLVLVGIVNLVIFLAFGEVVLRTKEKHQLAGHAEKYLGKKGKSVTAFAMFFGNLGALLVYMIGIGDFSHALLKDVFDGTPFLYTMIFFVLASLALLVGLNMVVLLEKIMVIVLFLIVGAFLLVGFPEISLSNLLYVNGKNLLLPYGVLLFAFGGVTAVSEMIKVLKEKKKLKKSILIGTIIPFVTYLLFALVVVGVAGKGTSQEAILGLEGSLGVSVVVLGAILGIVTMGTSFLTLGLITKRLLVDDYKLNTILAWVLTCFVPFIIYLAGLTNFIEVITIVGGISGGLNGIIVLLIHRASKTKGKEVPCYSLKIPKFIFYTFLGMFFLGIIYEIVFVFLQ